jgi:hypothetical protein
VRPTSCSPGRGSDVLTGFIPMLGKDLGRGKRPRGRSAARTDSELTLSAQPTPGRHDVTLERLYLRDVHRTMKATIVRISSRSRSRPTSIWCWVFRGYWIALAARFVEQTHDAWLLTAYHGSFGQTTGLATWWTIFSR